MSRVDNNLSELPPSQAIEQNDIEDKKSVDYKVDENTERGNWSGKFDFFLSCMGYAVGLGNVWRFPYLCYQSGGGAFLIPYILMLFLIGLPVFYFEMSFGQFSNLGPLTIWKIQPMFKGIGYAMVITNVMVSVYYNVIIAWSFYYLFASLTSYLPWSDCNNAWNDKLCRINFQNVSSIACTKLVTTNCTKFQVPSEQYWQRKVLGFMDFNGEKMPMEPFLGDVQWHLCLCLLLAWIICTACLIKGVKSSGKVVYFTAIFPYIVIIIMVINGATLEGSLDGVKFYIIPKWERLLDFNVWAVAASQIFYSLGVGFGGVLTMASYNRFNNNVQRDSIIVPIINCSTSFLAGFAIFSVLGFISHQTGRSITDTATGGTGLAFVVYAQGVATMPGAPFWSILFFMMLITLGIDSQFGGMEVIYSGIQDEWPVLRKTRFRDVTFKIVVAIFMFFLGIPLISKGGVYLFTILDRYSGSYTVLVISLSELIVVQYLYGFKKFAKDIKMMSGSKPNIYWFVCWLVLTPVVVIVVLVVSFVYYKRSVYIDTLPMWADILGYLMALAGILPIPIYAIIYAIRKGCTKTPELEWGPGVRKFWSLDERYAEKLRNNPQLHKNQNQDLEESYPNCYKLSGLPNPVFEDEAKVTESERVHRF